MSNRIAVFDDGVVQQLSTPEILYEKPENSFVAQFIGENNRFEGTLKNLNEDKCQVELTNGEKVTALKVNVGEVGSKTELSIRPERVLINSSNDLENNFKGKVKETRKGLRSGHIPGSKNIFWGNLINHKGTLVSKKKINNIFNKFHIKNKKIITSCGSGITACILSLSLLHRLKIQTSVYDGSWTEWGQNKKLPIEK